MKALFVVILLAVAGLVILCIPRLRRFSLMFFLVALVLAGWKTRLTQWEDLVIRPFQEKGPAQTLLLETGQALPAMVTQARSLGIVADRENLLYWLRRFGADRTMKAGSYSVTAGPSWDVARQLSKATPQYFEVTFIPGAFPRRPFGDQWTEEEQVKALEKTELFPQAMRELLPETISGRSACLLPETYSLVKLDVEEAVKAAAAAWWDLLGNQIATAQDLAHYSIVASLIEREAVHADESSTIAGVIENRLEKNMLLQIDASVVYAWALKGETVKRVLYRHLEVDSPYNTYRHQGLPPDPICVPSKKAWQGALAPQVHDFLYYVAKKDGTHQFTTTYGEHIKAVEENRR